MTDPVDIEDAMSLLTDPKVIYLGGPLSLAPAAPDVPRNLERGAEQLAKCCSSPSRPSLKNSCPQCPRLCCKTRRQAVSSQ
jgi:hypothetical protein